MDLVLVANIDLDKVQRPAAHQRHPAIPTPPHHHPETCPYTSHWYMAGARAPQGSTRTASSSTTRTRRRAFRGAPPTHGCSQPSTHQPSSNEMVTQLCDPPQHGRCPNCRNQLNFKDSAWYAGGLFSRWDVQSDFVTLEEWEEGPAQEVWEIGEVV